MYSRQLSIIIPVYNRFELTAACLRSLKEHLPGDLADFDYEIIVVDNGSEDATSTELPALGQALFSGRFHVLRHGENKKFAGGCNSGAKAACGAKLLFLNNDTLFTPGWFKPLWAALEAESGLGAVGPLLLYPEERVQHLGIGFQVGGTVHLYAHFPVGHPVVRRQRTGLQAITGAVILLEHVLFAECGGFYEGYWNGFEDLELCLRIREKGKSLAVIAQSIVMHLESQTHGRSAQEAQNSALFSSRCSYGFQADTHQFALQDGYVVSLSPSLGTIIELKPEAKKALAPLLAEQPAEAYQALLAEPLWPEAYCPVCRWLEEQGALDKALYLRFLESRFYLGMEGLQAWARLAMKNKNKELVDYVGTVIKKCLEREQNRNLLRKRALSNLGLARQHGDAVLQSMLSDWLLARAN